MTKSTEEIIEVLKAFQPLDDEIENVDFLYDKTDVLLQNDDAIKALPSLFNIFENNPYSELGSPGPLIHTIEKFSPEYEKELFESLERKPTYYTIWMLNRLVNNTFDPQKRNMFFKKVSKIIKSPETTEEIRQQAREIIDEFVNNK